MLIRRLFLIILSIFAVLEANARFKSLNKTNIRVAIARSVSGTAINGEMAITSSAAEGFEMRVRRAEIKVSENRLEVNGRPAPLRLALFGKNLTINGKHYNGLLMIYKEPNGSITIVNHIPLEEYLVGILASEMPLDWPSEALKAQAVSARTYALYQMNARKEGYNYDVEATTMDQVYAGAGKAADTAKRAVEETSGQIIVKNGRAIKAFFHSTCGGETETSLNVWGDTAEFKAVKDPYCKRSPNRSWIFSISKQEMVAKMLTAGFPAENIESIHVEKKHRNRRAATVVVDTGKQTLYLQGNDLRKILGYENLKSTWFSTRISGGRVAFEGHGYGHGVGMCQWGAKGMAETGKSYRDILRFYYPGVSLRAP